jgi:hypothetical protein
VFIVASPAEVADANRVTEGRLSGSPPAVERWRDGAGIASCIGWGPWATEPGVGRTAYGVPATMDRKSKLGNAVVPQIAEYIGRRLMAASAPSPRVAQAGREAVA